MQSRTATWVLGGRYRVDGLLGEGGMARVYGGFDQRLERPVAIKLLRPETRALAGMRQRFQREAHIAARLVHPHIVAVLDYGEEDSSSYLVMERLPGTTLRDEIIRGPLSQRRLMLVVTETLSAISAAHRRGVIHRDIKPSNILIQDDGHTKITDFGIAKSADGLGQLHEVTDDMTMTGVILGTPGYLAPERRSGQPATVQSDVYALGAVMLEAVTGRRVTSGNTGLEILAPPFREVARRALATDPSQRFASADDMLRALTAPATRPITNTQSASGAPTEPIAPTATRPGPGRADPPPGRRGGTAVLQPQLAVRPDTGPGPEPRRHRARRWIALTAVALAALLIALFFVLLGTTHTTGQPTTSSHHATDAAAERTTTTTTEAQTSTTEAPVDPEQTAITSLASSLAAEGLPGDGALASALAATAAEPPGSDRVGMAEQTISLAQILLAGGGISHHQYQDVVNVLAPTGATPPPAGTTPLPGGTSGGILGGGGPGSPHGHHDSPGDQG